MAATTRKQPPARRAKRSLLTSRPALPVPRLELEAHQVDIIGLALVAIGVFLAGVAYLSWSGGALGNAFVHGARFAFGRLGYAIPAVLVLGGGLVLMRELRPPGRPLRTGAICVTAAITLGLAAGRRGLGPGQPPSGSFWRAAAFESRGGVVGQGELWISSHLLSTIGADILAVFLFLAGAILVSGATLAGVIRATGAGVAGTSRALKRTTGDFAQTVARRPATEAGRSRVAERAGALGVEPPPMAEAPPVLPEDPEPLFPPEPDTS